MGDKPGRCWVGGARGFCVRSGALFVARKFVVLLSSLGGLIGPRRTFFSLLPRATVMYQAQPHSKPKYIMHHGVAWHTIVPSRTPGTSLAVSVHRHSTHLVHHLCIASIFSCSGVYRQVNFEWGMASGARFLKLWQAHTRPSNSEDICRL